VKKYFKNKLKKEIKNYNKNNDKNKLLLIVIN